jgi:hypothetical protein
VRKILVTSVISFLFGAAGANAEVRTGTSIVPAAQIDPPFLSKFARGGGARSLDGSELPIAAGCASLAVSW